MQFFVLDGLQLRQPFSHFLKKTPGRIRASVVYDNDFMRDIVQAKLHMQVLNGRANAALFILGRNDDGQKFERLFGLAS
jgi:hypothetical protein